VVSNPTEPEYTPLEMAQNAARAVLRVAHYQGRDPLGSYLDHAGERGHDAAHLAGAMALVSIAEDMHRIVAIMTGEATGLLNEWAAKGEEAGP
jgi:hypothetical protein